MALSLRFGAVSDIGRTRKKNDDSGYAGPNFLMVADGMGGAAAGDLASAVAVQTMQRLDGPAPADLLEALAGAVHRANDRLSELIEDDPTIEGMGTTVTAVLFDNGLPAEPGAAGTPVAATASGDTLHGDELAPITDADDNDADPDTSTDTSGVGPDEPSEAPAANPAAAGSPASARIGVAHLGDSRGYLWRDGELLRISHDHSWVQSLIDEGRITEAEARVHSHRSLLLKVLDGRHDNSPDLTVYDVRAGDRILICSDGLSGFVEHDRIARVMSIGSADAVAHELLQLALEAASTDNITVVVGDVVDEPADPAVEALVVGSAADNPRGAFSRLRTWAQRDEVDPNEHLVDPDVDPEQLRYAPREPHRFRWLIRGVAIVVVMAAVAGLAKLAYDWSQRQYYVAAEDGQVAIFRGVQADLPLLDLHRVYETQSLMVSELPLYRRDQVIEGLAADDLDDARSIVERLDQMATTCALQAAASESRSSASASSSAPPRTTGTKGPDGTPRGDDQQSGRPDDQSGDQSGDAATPEQSNTSPGGTGSDSRRSPEECSGATPAPSAVPDGPTGSADSQSPAAVGR